MAILTINSGSSSLKFGLYADDGGTLLVTGGAKSIGKPGASLKIEDAGGKELFRSADPFPHQDNALGAIAEQLGKLTGEPVTAIGHRIVHGGPHLVTHQAITPELLSTLERSVHFAPLHIPPAIALIHATGKRFPDVAQFACFDTAFHQTLPPEAFTYALPKPYREAGIRRYGFHGLSYESVVHALGDALPSRTIVAHLGSGSSLCAMDRGRSVDTSMGLSPTGGVVMGTRTGDLDPGVLLLLERDLGPELPALSPDRLESMINHDSGLQALAGDSDMEAITQRMTTDDAEATLAHTIFCRSVAKTIAAYAAVLGGLDLLVFTGGIGEHSAITRRRIVDQLAFLSIQLSQDEQDEPEAKPPVPLSASSSAVEVRVLAADEDGQIARHVAALRAV